MDHKQQQQRLFLIFTLLVATLIRDAYSGECYNDMKTAGLTSDMAWIKASIARHNQYRAQHGACPLVFNHKLSEVSQEWANNLAARGAFEHRVQQCVGENLAMKGSTGPLNIVKDSKVSQFAVDGWYNEIKDYNFKTGKPVPGGGQIGHLTQVLWQDSKEVGIAYASYQKDGWTKYVVVANYYPPGNYVGMSPQKVFPKGTPTSGDCPAAGSASDETESGPSGNQDGNQYKESKHKGKGSKKHKKKHERHGGDNSTAASIFVHPPRSVYLLSILISAAGVIRRALYSS